jgi:hypothetical protein
MVFRVFQPLILAGMLERVFKISVAYFKLLLE